MKLITLLLGLPLLALGASLQARSLPDVDAGCNICKPGQPAYEKWQADVKSVPQDMIKEAKASFGKSFPADFKPPPCSHVGVSCVYLDPGFVWERNTASLIQDPIGKYLLKDGRKYNLETIFRCIVNGKHCLRILSLAPQEYTQVEEMPANSTSFR